MMRDFRISYVKPNRCKLDTDHPLYSLVYNHFSFYDKSLTHSKNDKIPSRRYVIQKSGNCGTGLILDIKKLFQKEEWGVDVVLSDRVKEDFIRTIGCPIVKPKSFSDDVGTMKERDYQLESIKQSFKLGRGIFHIGTGGGKCLAENTPILMHSGEIKNVQDIQVDDVLMGDDGGCRTVASTCTGIEQMYTIKMKDGTSFKCNESHILSLVWNGVNGKKHKKNNVYDYSILEYMNLTKKEKHCLKAIKTGVDFPQKRVNVDPYLMGLWLAEGAKTAKSKNNLFICSEDIDIFNYLENNYTVSYSDGNIRGTCKKVRIWDGKKYSRSNIYNEEFKKCIKNENVFIHNDYKINSRENRLQLLAGLIDGDGHLHNNCYDIISKWETLSNDIAYLVRSLGMRAYMGEKYVDGVKYYRIGISGNTHMIPCKVVRKQAEPRSQIKNVMRCGFDIIKEDVGRYYGFEIHGNNRRFLLGDFTITHNTLIMSILLESIYQDNPDMKCVVVVPNIGLRKQTFTDFKNYECSFSFDTWSSQEDVNEDVNVLIVNTNTFQRDSRMKGDERVSKKDEYGHILEKMDIIIWDEVHLFHSDPEPKATKLLKKYQYKHMFGFTGSLVDNTFSKYKIIEFFGPVIYTKSTRELRDENYLSEAEINMIEFNHKDVYRIYEFNKDDNKTENYNRELNYVIDSDLRNDKIHHITKSVSGNMLILVERIRQGEALVESLSKIEGREVYFINGDMPVEERNRIQKKMENQDNIICIAMSKIFHLGISINNIPYLMFAYMGKSWAKTIQSIGRGLRLHENKKLLKIIDLYDNLMYSKQHAIERIKIYDNQKVKFKKYKVNE